LWGVRFRLWEWDVTSDWRELAGVCVRTHLASLVAQSLSQKYCKDQTFNTRIGELDKPLKVCHDRNCWPAHPRRQRERKSLEVSTAGGPGERNVRETAQDKHSVMVREEEAPASDSGDWMATYGSSASKRCAEELSAVVSAHIVVPSVLVPGVAFTITDTCPEPTPTHRTHPSSASAIRLTQHGTLSRSITHPHTHPHTHVMQRVVPEIHSES
jgi:hypothetical protein